MSALFVATKDLETAPLADGAVLYNGETGKFVMLNRSADLLWSELANAKTEDELVRGLCRAYAGVDTGTAREAVSRTLESLRGLDLVRVELGEGDAPATPAEDAKSGGGARTDYAPPSVSVLAEDDLLKVFQMTAAEISVASCWWGACTSGCP